MKRLGILGTFVWDTVWTLADQAAGRPLETWGGMSFSLASAAAMRPEGWEIVPIAHVGADLLGRAHELLDTLGGIVTRDAVVSVPQPNNRVELVYTDAASRGEKMSGGVPGWTWDELAPHLDGLDALYVNFLSGWELDLAAAKMLRHFPHPVYADLHSLFLGPPLPGGPREPRRLPRPAEWLGSFDVVQMNAEEFELLTDTRPDAPEALEGVYCLGPRAVFVTQGSDGARYMARRGLLQPGESPSTVAHGQVPAVPHAPGGDPTGCGDVWGASLFCGLLGGLDVERAVRRANAVAAAKLEHRGGSGLYEHLTARRGAWDAEG
ncbi:carbohydrate kinase family protein [Longimicrobium sp.]|uniref:carbohydrate kinase family protein n=1 Tax=Longimicrobium sp. TaxID=2029185 RepID=UPI002CB13C27|nr:carbohydrate kinase family protein [Longimicrobium sp.]HSU15894.1 carbohydrate kinase family protein [Longimicrobium sp.]